VYEPAGDGLSVTIPARHYELMAEILADGVANTAADGVANTAAGRADTPVDLAHRSAYRRGVVAGADMRADGLIAALERLGFEPDGRDPRVTLHNCPFHALAATHTELVCGLNHALISGLVDGLGVQANPRLAPQPGRCCVELDRGEGGNRR
jgi:predicted ArsR family transcriptional regulator